MDATWEPCEPADPDAGEPALAGAAIATTDAGGEPPSAGLMPYGLPGIALMSVLLGAAAVSMVLPDRSSAHRPVAAASPPSNERSPSPARPARRIPVTVEVAVRGPEPVQVATVVTPTVEPVLPAAALTVPMRVPPGEFVEPVPPRETGGIVPAPGALDVVPPPTVTARGLPAAPPSPPRPPRDPVRRPNPDATASRDPVGARIPPVRTLGMQRRTGTPDDGGAHLPVAPAFRKLAAPPPVRRASQDPPRVEARGRGGPGLHAGWSSRRGDGQARRADEEVAAADVEAPRRAPGRFHRTGTGRHVRFDLPPSLRPDEP